MTRLARVLIEADRYKERAVGVAMDAVCGVRRGVVGGQVKAGGVYVPVDQAHPVEQSPRVLDAAGAVCVFDRWSRHRQPGLGPRPSRAHRRSGRIRRSADADHRR